MFRVDSFANDPKVRSKIMGTNRFAGLLVPRREVNIQIERIDFASSFALIHMGMKDTTLGLVASGLVVKVIEKVGR